MADGDLIGWNAEATDLAREVARLAAKAEGPGSMSVSLADLVVALADEVDRYRNLTEKAARMAHVVQEQRESRHG